MNVDEGFRASARRIGLRMALLCAGLVLLGAVIFLAAILWKVDV